MATFEFPDLRKLLAETAEENGGLQGSKISNFVKRANTVLDGHRHIEEAGAEGIRTLLKNSRVSLIGRFALTSCTYVVPENMNTSSSDLLLSKSAMKRE